MSEDETLDRIENFIKKNIFDKHKKKCTKEFTKLKNYQINPILIRYLSKAFAKEMTSTSVAKALYYPRAIGTSITTSFGTNMQNMLVKEGLAEPSMLKGMDIEFIDKTDNRRKWCQLKSGPNTINSGDVDPLIENFESIIRRAKTNRADIVNSDFVIGLLYGRESELSQHYRRIDETYPVYIGLDFWHRLTGFESFYDSLIKRLNGVIEEVAIDEAITSGIEGLAQDIEDSGLLK